MVLLSVIEMWYLTYYLNGSLVDGCAGNIDEQKISVKAYILLYSCIQINLVLIFSIFIDELKKKYPHII